MVVSDGDDQGPSFEYQGCVRYNGACINAQYTATVTNKIKVSTAQVATVVMLYQLPGHIEKIISLVTHRPVLLWLCCPVTPNEMISLSHLTQLVLSHWRNFPSIIVPGNGRFQMSNLVVVWYRVFGSVC